MKYMIKIPLLMSWLPSALPVAKMQNIDPATILEARGMVFDENEQEITDLANLPYEDLDGKEIKIFDLEGTLIPRRVPFFSPTAPAGGPLFQLDNVTSMFDHFHHGDRTGHVDVSIYPQAFMTRYGHLQANTVLPEFHQAAQAINSDLLSRERPVQTSRDRDSSVGQSDEEDPDYQPSNPSSPSDDGQPLAGEELDSHEVEDLLHRHAVEPVKGVFFQGYNLLQHRIARRSGGAETMHGMVTAALAGDYAQHTERMKAEEMSSYVEREMPFNRMKAKLNSDVKPPTDLRLENYWTINFTGIAEKKRTGG
jgi:hypothetical protein